MKKIIVSFLWIVVCASQAVGSDVEIKYICTSENGIVEVKQTMKGRTVLDFSKYYSSPAVGMHAEIFLQVTTFNSWEQLVDGLTILEQSFMNVAYIYDSNLKDEVLKKRDRSNVFENTGKRLVVEALKHLPLDGVEKVSFRLDKNNMSLKFKKSFKRILSLFYKTYMEDNLTCTVVK
jgi:hypothetical protein